MKLWISTQQGFNPRPRMGGDEARWNDERKQADVSIHAPAWGATREIFCMKSIARGFNPRPRMGGDPSVAGALVVLVGFNPRPRMGGDFAYDPYNGGDNVSIHAPAWGATKAAGGWRGKRFSFNPRPRMGGDQRDAERDGRHRGFNPRPRMGGDPFNACSHCRLGLFQSTPPHGGRPH